MSTEGVRLFEFGTLPQGMSPNSLYVCTLSLRQMSLVDVCLGRWMAGEVRLQVNLAKSYVRGTESVAWLAGRHIECDASLVPLHASNSRLLHCFLHAANHRVRLDFRCKTRDNFGISFSFSFFVRP